MTLSAGIISAAELNAEFSAQTAALTTQAAVRGKDFTYVLDAPALTSTAGPSHWLDFSAPDDLEVLVLGVSAHQNDATSRTITAAFLAVALNAEGTLEDISDTYLLGDPLTVSVTATSATSFHARLNLEPSTGTKIFLVKGVQYRLALASSSASPLLSAQAQVHCRSRRRRG